eukprot:3380761-Prymnesium_polylepis.1
MRSGHAIPTATCYIEYGSSCCACGPTCVRVVCQCGGRRPRSRPRGPRVACAEPGVIDCRGAGWGRRGASSTV